MKRKITYFLIAMLSISMAFVSCSKDSDSSWKKVPTTEIKGENVVSVVNGKASNSGSIQMSVMSAEQGVVSLNNLIFGYDTLPVDVALTKSGDDSYDFIGETVLNSASKKSELDLDATLKVKVSGNITLAGKATVNVSTEAMGGLVGTWSLPDTVITFDDVNMVETSPILMKWPPLIPGDGTDIRNGQQISNLAGMVAPHALCEVLNQISFNADGSIVAKYYPTIIMAEGQDVMTWIMSKMTSSKFVPSEREWITSPVNFASWTVKGDYLYVLPNIEEIVKALAKDVDYKEIEGILQMLMTADDDTLKSLVGMASEAIGIDLSVLEPAQIRQILTWTKTGVPLRYRSEAGMLYIYVDKKMVAPFMSMLFPMLPMLQSELDKMAETDPLVGLLPMFLMVDSLTDIETIWKTNTTDVFELGIMLKK